MKPFLSLSLFLLTTQLLLAQNNEVKILKGKVVSNAIDLEGIYIINLKTEAATSSEKEGYFSIHAAVGDTLMFSALQIKGKKMVLTESDFEKDLLLVRVEPMVNRLDEVIVKQYKNINAVDLGIIPANTKHYTPAERKLKAASGADLAGNTDGTMGGSVGLDPLFNWMSGRTALLKQELEVERKETLLQKIENQFGVAYFTEKLKIPEEYVKGFWYYIVEENRFVTAMNNKNKTMAVFVLTELAVKYIELQKEDTK